jgi:hypothetical protein
MFLCCVRCSGITEFSPVSVSPALLIFTLLPLPFAWHLPLDKRGSLFSIKVVKKEMSRSQLGVNVEAQRAASLQDEEMEEGIRRERHLKATDQDGEVA